MSDIEVIHQFKQKYASDPKEGAAEYLALNLQVNDEESKDSPDLGHDAHRLSLLGLAVSDLKLDQHEPAAAKIMYDEAVKQLLNAKNHGQDVTETTRLAQNLLPYIEHELHP